MFTSKASYFMEKVDCAESTGWQKKYIPLLGEGWGCGSSSLRICGSKHSAAVSRRSNIKYFLMWKLL